MQHDNLQINTWYCVLELAATERQMGYNP